MRHLPFLLTACLAPFCAGASPGLILSRTLPVITQGNLNSGLIRAVAVDAAGNTYLAGSTQNPLFPVTPGAVQPAFGGGTCTDPTTNPLLPPVQHPCDDAFVVKLDPKGQIVFATYLGGTGGDEGESIAVDGQGFVYIAGETGPGNLTSSNNFPVTRGGAFGNAASGGAFLAKLSPAGTAVVYSMLIPGASGKTSVAVDSQGNAYFSTTAPTFPVTGGALQTAGSVAAGKLDPSGSRLIYGARFGGSPIPYAGEAPSSIAVDLSGNAYITGVTPSTTFPVTAGAFQVANKSGTFTGFVAKLNSSGTSLAYATYLGGKIFDSGLNIRVDAQGSAYILGFTQSPDFPVSAAATVGGASQPPDSGFLTKLTPDGARLVYSTFISRLAGSGVSSTSAMDIDIEGNAYVAGIAARPVAVAPGSLQPCAGGGGQDIFVARADAAGKLAEATYFGGSGRESVSAIAAGPRGIVSVAGITNSPDFPLTIGSEPLTDVSFVARFALSDSTRSGAPCMTPALENAASNIEGPVAPGELVTLRGLGFGPATGMSMQVDASGNIATELAGVRVFFGNTAAPLLYVQSEQINAQAPWELAGDNTKIHVEYQGLSTQVTEVAVTAAAPDFFRVFYNSTQGAVLNQDRTLNAVANPAKPGDVVAIWGTGGGAINPALGTGSFAPLAPLSRLIQQPLIRLDAGLDAEVTYAGAAPTAVSGMFQINFRLPESVQPGTHTVHVAIGPYSSSPAAQVTIEVR